MLCLVSRIAVHLKALNLSKLVRNQFLGVSRNFIFQGIFFRCFNWNPVVIACDMTLGSSPRAFTTASEAQRQGNFGKLGRHSVVAYLAFVLAFALADSSNELFICDLSYTLNCCLDVELSNKGSICAGNSATAPRNLALIVKRQGSSRDKLMSKRGTEYEGACSLFLQAQSLNT